MMDRINAAIGHIKLDSLQPHHLITFYNNLEEKGIRDDYKYNCKIDLNAKLKELRLTKGAIAEKAGVSEATIRSITRKVNVSKRSAELVAKALNIPLMELFIAVGADGTLSGKQYSIITGRYLRYFQPPWSGRL
jgi:DNA-binding XRE family transcriptional regulator